MFSTTIITHVIKQMSNRLYVYPGGTIAPLLHEAKRDEIAIIVAKNEQGAGYMALAEALSTHRPAFVAVTSGPGITNLITVIADAYYDSIPLIVFSGQVGTPDLDRGDNLRQRGFQEIPIIEMVKKITKKTYQPRSTDEMTSAIYEGISIAQSGRKGPILIDLPMNIQLQELNDDISEYTDNILTESCENDVSDEILLHSINLINNAKKPLILIGGGAQEHWELVRNFVISSTIPSISSLRGLGILSNSDTCGWIGHTGMPWSNAIFYEADTILVLGSRLDIRQTGSQTASLAGKNIIHVDIDEQELSHCRIPNTIQIKMCIKEFIKGVVRYLNPTVTEEWKDCIDNLKNTLKLDDTGKADFGINPSQLFETIEPMLERKKWFITTGVGSHQHWAARYLKFDNSHRRLFTSAGHGTMGFGLPVAIGLQILHPDIHTLCVDGDGSFQMNIQELALIQELKLPIKIIVLDNSRLGIVSQFQQITFGDDPTTGDSKTPDFCKIAESYGISAFILDTLDETIIQDWLNCTQASLLHVKIKHDAPLSPMLLGGQELNAMWYANEQ